MATKQSSGSTRNIARSAQSAVPSAPGDVMRESFQGLLDVLVQRASHSVTGKIESATQGLTRRMEDVPALASGVRGLAEGKPLKAALGATTAEATQKVKEALSGLTGGRGGAGGRGKLKITNIVEAVDVGVPVDVAYDQWTRFTDFPTFMKKVEHVEQKSEETLGWTAQVFWSHRTWESKIVEQVPDERIVWTSKGNKGRVDGAVTFHELAPSLTRVVVVLAYQPKGLFEHTGNLFRAQGRRARLELKHFQRHVMTDTVLHVDELEGWRGEIHDGEVTPPEEADAAPPRRSPNRSTRRSSSDEEDSRSRRAPATKRSGSARTRESSSTRTRESGSARTRESGSTRTRGARSTGKAGKS